MHSVTVLQCICVLITKSGVLPLEKERLPYDTIVKHRNSLESDNTLCTRNTHKIFPTGVKKLHKLFLEGRCWVHIFNYLSLLLEFIFTDFISDEKTIRELGSVTFTEGNSFLINVMESIFSEAKMSILCSDYKIKTIML